jgi:HSP20 family molecular chaperone IbpA
MQKTAFRKNHPTGLNNMVPYSEKEILSDDMAELVTTLQDEGKYFRVIAEFQDISGERIHIDLEKTVLAITATQSESGKNIKKLGYSHISTTKIDQ